MPLICSVFEPIDHAVDAIVSLWPDEWASDNERPSPDLREYMHTRIFSGAPLANGMVLSKMVLDQLREAGINPEWCTYFELAAAERAAAVDCTVFDEPDGDNFFDNLELDTEEIAAKDTSTFHDRLQQRREKHMISIFNPHCEHGAT